MIYVFALILILGLAVLSYIDLRTFRLPDMITLPLIAIGILQAWVLGGNVKASIIGSLVGYAIFVLIETAYRRLRGQDGLGRGDAKLLAVGGAWCGWSGLPFIILIGSGTALIALLFPFMRSIADEGHIPFGPFLALGILIVWFSMGFAYAPY